MEEEPKKITRPRLTNKEKETARYFLAEFFRHYGLSEEEISEVMTHGNPNVVTRFYAVISHMPEYQTEGISIPVARRAIGTFFADRCGVDVSAGVVPDFVRK